jgi:hypothetical protein
LKSYPTIRIFRRRPRTAFQHSARQNNGAVLDNEFFGEQASRHIGSRARASPPAVALVRLRAKKTRRLGFQNLLNRALHQAAQKVLVPKSSLPSRRNIRTLSLASHLSPPWKCRLGKQHPKESNRWLARARQSDASTEL